MKLLRNNPAYNHCYHFIASTKYRKSVFIENEMQTRLKDLLRVYLFF